MDETYYAGSASDQAYEGTSGYTADPEHPPPHNNPHAVHSEQGTAAHWQQDLAVSSTHNASLAHPLAGFDYPVYPPQAHFSHTDDSANFLAHSTQTLQDDASFEAHTNPDTWLSLQPQHQAQAGNSSHTQHTSEYHPLPTGSHHHVAISSLPVKTEARSQSPVPAGPLVPSTPYSPPSVSAAGDEATTAGTSETLQHDFSIGRGPRTRFHGDHSAFGSLHTSDTSSSDSDEGSASTATGPAETSSSRGDEIDSLLRDNPPRQRSDGVKKKNARFEIPPERKIDTIDRIITETDPSNKALLKELKQQKRLLRNRQAALDSRSRKKEHTRKIEEECKYLRIKMTEMDEELAKYRQEQEQRTAERVQWQRKIDQILTQKEELIRMHAMETAALRQRCILLEADLQRRSSSTHHSQH